MNFLQLFWNIPTTTSIIVPHQKSHHHVYHLSHSLGSSSWPVCWGGTSRPASASSHWRGRAAWGLRRLGLSSRSWLGLGLSRRRWNRPWISGSSSKFLLGLSNFLSCIQPPTLAPMFLHWISPAPPFVMAKSTTRGACILLSLRGLVWLWCMPNPLLSWSPSLLCSA